MASVKKYCKKYSDIVPIEHTFKEHRLMICPYADYDHKINPIGYKFPETGLKNISYYRDCADVDHYDPLFGDIDFIDEILYLDYKLIDKVELSAIEPCAKSATERALYLPDASIVDSK